MYGHSDMKPDYHRAFQCCTQPIANTIPYCQARLGDIQSETPHPYAQHIIGEMFLHGEGVPKDLAVAKEWFQIAATQGYEPSQTKITQIAHLESSAVIQQEKVPEHQEKRSRWSLGFFNSKKK
ncbi:hypothetical protein BDB01DRAFT_887653 [Pilobolus umbonatus]|nr:hypothetical protein BDB01DRAFT_887653 [Pilobolus umbonatus]